MILPLLMTNLFVSKRTLIKNKKINIISFFRFYALSTQANLFKSLKWNFRQLVNKNYVGASKLNLSLFWLFSFALSSSDNFYTAFILYQAREPKPLFSLKISLITRFPG